MYFLLELLTVRSSRNTFMNKKNSTTIKFTNKKCSANSSNNNKSSTKSIKTINKKSSANTSNSNKTSKNTSIASLMITKVSELALLDELRHEMK